MQIQVCNVIKTYTKIENYFEKAICFFFNDIDVLLLKASENGIDYCMKYNYESLTKENFELKKLLNLQTKYINKKPKFAKIFINFSNDYVKRMMINVGKLNGVSDSDVVMDCDGNLIGRLSNIYDNYSEVMLITDSNSNIPCIINNKINCLIKGNYTNNPELIFIDDNFNHYIKNNIINNNDVVETSSIGGVFPKNIMVGTLIIEKNAFFVRPFVDINNIKYVMVFKNHDE